MRPQTWDDWCEAVDEMQWIVGQLNQSAGDIRSDAQYLESRELKINRWHYGVEQSYLAIKEEMESIRATLALLETVMTRLESIRPWVLDDDLAPTSYKEDK